MTYKYSKSLSLVLDRLLEQEIISGVVKDFSYFDEPPLHRFGARLLFHPARSAGSPPRHQQSAAGVSFFDSDTALYKCLGEAMERYSLYHFRKRKTVSAINFTGKKDVAIPASLVYPNYPHSGKRGSVSTTGAAGSFNKDEALLRGLYEVLERDAVMCAYLLKSGWEKIKTASLPEKVTDIIRSYEKYRLEVSLFSIKNMFGVPTFVAFLTDRSGFAPTLVAGARTDLDYEMAMVGSLEEAALTRPWLRTRAAGLKTTASPLLKRANYWQQPEAMGKLAFLFRLHPVTYRKPPSLPPNIRGRFKLITEKLAGAGYETYGCDITHQLFMPLKYSVWRVIVPGLQSRYTDERYRLIDRKRLNRVASFYGLTSFAVNRIPHPFL